MTTNKFNEMTTYFGCHKACKNLKISVKMEFDCDYFNHATSFLSEILKGQENYEIIYNSDKEKITVLIYPDNIKL